MNEFEIWRDDFLSSNKDLFDKLNKALKRWNVSEESSKKLSEKIVENCYNSHCYYIEEDIKKKNDKKERKAREKSRVKYYNDVVKTVEKLIRLIESDEKMIEVLKSNNMTGNNSNTVHLEALRGLIIENKKQIMGIRRLRGTIPVKQGPMLINQSTNKRIRRSDNQAKDSLIYSLALIIKRTVINLPIEERSLQGSSIPKNIRFNQMNEIIAQFVAAVFVDDKNAYHADQVRERLEYYSKRRPTYCGW